MDKVIEALIQLLFNKAIISEEEFNHIKMNMYNGASFEQVARAIRNVAEENI